MTTNDVTRILPVAGAAGAAATAPANAAPGGGASFQALLERLQRFAADKASTPAVDSPDDLREAMRAADASFTTAMDLRRQLEDAFRRHQP